MTKNGFIAGFFLCLSNATFAQTSIYHNDEAAQRAVQFAPGSISTPERFEINTVFNEAGDNVIFARCNDEIQSLHYDGVGLP